MRMRGRCRLGAAGQATCVAATSAQAGKVPMRSWRRVDWRGHRRADPSTWGLSSPGQLAGGWAVSARRACRVKLTMMRNALLS
jgi:hypothetical protein